MSAAANSVLTVGHSNQTIESFLALLQKHAVTAIADVRSAPFSRYSPQFNKEALKRSLKACGIRYAFLGRELGARSEDPSCYDNGRVQYGRLARTGLFQAGIERVMSGARKFRVALMCTEKDPLECHRTLLVAKALHERGLIVTHILADGRLEDQEEAMLRLLDITGIPHSDLFRSRESLVADALIKQEERIAYVDERLAAETTGDAP